MMDWPIKAVFLNQKYAKTKNHNVRKTDLRRCFRILRDAAMFRKPYAFISENSQSPHLNFKNNQITWRSALVVIIRRTLPEFFGSEAEQKSLKRVAFDQISNLHRLCAADLGRDTWIIRASYKYRRKSMDQVGTSDLRSYFEVFEENFAKSWTWAS